VATKKEAVIKANFKFFGKKRAEKRKPLNPGKIKRYSRISSYSIPKASK
jgi:hypothetical protein